ncbi:MAG: hypothetical protein ACXVB0_21275, partial [Mucilaginibacter sp.]
MIPKTITRGKNGRNTPIPLVPFNSHHWFTYLDTASFKDTADEVEDKQVCKKCEKQKNADLKYLLLHSNQKLGNLISCRFL